MVGTGYNGSDRVTAIIFPLRVKIFPANARGLLQVVSYAESRIDAKDKFIKPETFNQAELDDLKETNINSYPIAAFKNYYPHYCELARKYFCNSYPSRELHWWTLSRLASLGVLAKGSTRTALLNSSRPILRFL